MKLCVRARDVWNAWGIVIRRWLLLYPNTKAPKVLHKMRRYNCVQLFSRPTVVTHLKSTLKTFMAFMTLLPTLIIIVEAVPRVWVGYCEEWIGFVTDVEVE